jgi:uncharacterized membrane protein
MALTLFGVSAVCLAADALAGTALVAALGTTTADAPPLLAAAWSLLAAARFGVTLLPGHEPLITRYSRFDDAGPPLGGAWYTRALTLAWTIVFAGFALGFAAAAVLSWPILTLSVAQPVVCGGLFLGEHALRNRLFPQHGRATASGTLRAVGRAHGLIGRTTDLARGGGDGRPVAVDATALRHAG